MNQGRGCDARTRPIKFIVLPTQLKIFITKEILEQSKYCGTEQGMAEISRHCAIATALADMFRQVYVSGNFIYPFGIEHNQAKAAKIPLPLIAQQFIKLFDGFRLTPHLRLLLPEFEFTIEIPDEVIEQINIDEVLEVIRESEKSDRLQFMQGVIVHTR